jgi:hypothetical protein
MATTTLTPGKPVKLKVPTISVTGMTKPGKYTFQLVVTDKAGIASAPAPFVVTVSPG